MRTLILGGPGCGKTTQLLKIVDDALTAGIPPERIAYLAFTRKAALEAITRAVAKFGIDKKRFTYFRTLHSFCYQALGLKLENLMRDQNYAEIGQLLGIQFTEKGDNLNAVISSGKLSGDKAMYYEQLARLTLKPLESFVQRDKKVRVWDVIQYRDTLKRYKDDRMLYDFTDILEYYLHTPVKQRFDILIVDEAQDLSALQWQVAEKIAEHSDSSFFAGDDDQAIYKWAGADVEYFLKLRHDDKLVLPVSYRLPRVVFDLCKTISARISQRYDKDITPHSEGGAIHKYAEPEQVDLSNGSWLILARHHYLLTGIKQWLYTKGKPFLYEGASSVENESTKAIVAMAALEAGELVAGDTVKVLYKKLRRHCVTHGFKGGSTLIGDAQYTKEQLMTDHGLRELPKWEDGLQIPSWAREYYATIISRGESLTAAPVIAVSTIHAAKGGEADNVMVLTDISWNAHKELQEDGDDESRVFYVALSRAKKALHIIHPHTNRFYAI